MERIKPFGTVRIVISLLVVIAAGAYLIFSKLKAGVKEKKEPANTDQSIAVLPFVNMSKDTSQILSRNILVMD